MRMWLRGAAIVFGGLAASLAGAHWVDHTEVPDWARRGAVQWGHGGNIEGKIKWTLGGFGVDMPNLDLILHCGNTVQQTVAYLDDATRQKAEAAGLKRQPYICSKTIWWRRDFKTAPQLEQALVLKPDGARTILYSNPERYGGCYSNPLWLDYIKDRVRETLADTKWGKVHSIFFDNATDYDCYCPVCQEKFRAFTRETYGQELALSQPLTPEVRFAKKLFNAAEGAKFFRDIRTYLDTLDPEVIIAPNLHVMPDWSPYMLSHGATEMLFIEGGFSMPPEESTVLSYKVGLADTHGLCVGMMCGLSELLRRQRALKLDPGNEAGIEESFYYPEEHKLAMAEALACDGTYVQSFALREQKISVSDEPYQVAIREALHQYSGFWKAHPAVYKLAQPGARVAVLHGIMTQLADRGDHWRSLQETCDLLGRAGVPYEILNEEDLSAAQLAKFTLVLTAHVRLLSREQAGALRDYVAGGGRLVRLGGLAERDLLNRKFAADQVPELAALPEGEQTLGRGRVLCLPARPGEMKPEEFAAALERLAGPLPCRMRTASPRVFANLLRQGDRKALSVHLINSDFRYAPGPPVVDIRDDDDKPEARTYFADTRWRARKTLEVPDLTAAAAYVLRFLSSTCGSATDAFALVVSLNGQDLKTFKGTELNEPGWKQVAVPPGLLRATNEVVFRVTGQPNGHPDWVALRIDTSAATRRSAWSTDSGQTWSTADLSLDSGVQQGELMVRLGPAEDPDKVATVADFAGKLKVIPARNVDVTLAVTGRAPTGKFLTPEGANLTLKPTVTGQRATYRVPEVPLYGVLILPGL